MTEMSMPSLDAADEFGGLDHLVLPGQDPELLHRIHAALTAELEPANFIERMWVRDMAIEAVRLEHIRLADCAVQRHIQEEERTAENAGQDGEVSQPQDRALAKAHIRHMALITQLLELENNLMHERDRLIHQYDTRSGIVKAYQDAMVLIKEAVGDRPDG